MDPPGFLRHIDRGGLAILGLAHQRRFPTSPPDRLLFDRHVFQEDAPAQPAGSALAEGESGEAEADGGVFRPTSPDRFYLGGGRVRLPARASCGWSAFPSRLFTWTSRAKAPRRSPGAGWSSTSMCSNLHRWLHPGPGSPRTSSLTWSPDAESLAVQAANQNGKQRTETIDLVYIPPPTEKPQPVPSRDIRSPDRLDDRQ